MRHQVLGTTLGPLAGLVLALGCADPLTDKTPPAAGAAPTPLVVAERIDAQPKAVKLSPPSVAQPVKLTPEQLAERYPDGKYPVAEAVQAEFDMGAVDQDQPIEHVFAIRNAGKAPLRLEKAQGS